MSCKQRIPTPHGSAEIYISAQDVDHDDSEAEIRAKIAKTSSRIFPPLLEAMTKAKEQFRDYYAEERRKEIENEPAS